MTDKQVASPQKAKEADAKIMEKLEREHPIVAFALRCLSTREERFYRPNQGNDNFMDF